MALPMLPRVIIIPGNHETPIEVNWYLSVKRELEAKGFHVIANTMPDGYVASKEVWLPYIEEQLQNNPNSILIGHSSGAVAALRYAETHQVEGIIMVGACYTDLDDELERKSGYYSTPWQWDKIKKNAKWIVQFASIDDPFIPIAEPRHIQQQLAAEYHEYEDEGHFGTSFKAKNEFPEIVFTVLKKARLPLPL